MSQNLHTILPGHINDIAACAAARAMHQALYKHPITGTRIIAPQDQPPKGWQRILAACDERHTKLNPQPTGPMAA